MQPISDEGRGRIEWAGRQMPVLQLIKQRFAKQRSLRNVTLGACLHVTAETANLMLALQAGGARLALCASNPLSTQDSVAASLVKDFGIAVFAVHGEDKKTYYQHLNQVLDFHPQITMDDGADLVTLLHTSRKSQVGEVLGSSEETTTGVIRLRAMERDGSLKIPVMAVNDSDTKHLFDNRYGTGQSTVDGILRTTNILLAGKRVVVCGYGWCGIGIAMRMKGMGAQVMVTEVDPVRALEAVMDGLLVAPVREAVKWAQVLVTATGNKHVISVKDLLAMRDGVVVANSGHFNVEFDYEGIKQQAKSARLLRENLEELTLASGKKLYVLGEGRLINLVGAEGHPAEVMDLSFANQALAAEYLVQHAGNLKPKVHVLPKKLDQQVAALKLKAMGVKYDRLTAEQKRYLSSWQEGT
ncbi:MAG: adenosylhomocysteinase [Candidatus Chisholmbacteria bacterium RIFCSPHIGHO2_01_FULL_48_12]|uniref:Adenosylhomocysteinase n=1 Tax=Candidatus Chisholmbacteria bacterium RIFCSPHIGHO2_01_FULL_48_12 TaxID=1797589 RepID=A0A1G1VQM9_9BACT|nr:MAG: adenosylhomocysteinase [Candidatus Chisholmbacteria bacterium RIFCSPHIGHO2_01_FULL_48_12]